MFALNSVIKTDRMITYDQYSVHQHQTQQKAIAMPTTPQMSQDPASTQAQSTQARSSQTQSSSALSSPYQASLQQHYAPAQLIEHLRETLIAEGLNPEQLTPDDTAAIDQLHLGGRHASRQLAQWGDIQQEQQVLDIGCGPGGASRLLAAELGCQVIGVDLTPRFIEMAQWLNKATGLADKVSCLTADACQLPLADQSVDVIWSQHTLMNIEDQPRLMHEIRRVCRPQGRLLLHEIVQGDNPEPLLLPVPWAREPTHSHLMTLDTLSTQLEAHHWQINAIEDISENALQWRQKHLERESRGQPTILTPQLIFGPDFTSMTHNLIHNLQSDRIRIIALHAQLGEA